MVDVEVGIILGSTIVLTRKVTCTCGLSQLLPEGPKILLHVFLSIFVQLNHNQATFLCLVMLVMGIIETNMACFQLYIVSNPDFSYVHSGEP